jgi:hypothetical protein
VGGQAYSGGAQGVLQGVLRGTTEYEAVLAGHSRALAFVLVGNWHVLAGYPRSTRGVLAGYLRGARGVLVGSCVILPRARGCGSGRSAGCRTRFAAGLTFTNRALKAEWPGRSGHTSVVDKTGAIYIIGGFFGGSNYYHDVWASTDGGARAGLSRRGWSGGTLGGYSGGTTGISHGN